METLVMVEHHRNQGYARSKVHFTDRFTSSPSRGFRGANCRSFEFHTGRLSKSPKLKCPVSQSEPQKACRRRDSISISPKPSPKLATFCEDHSYSELWAGPTYSYSPPPSSLPLPKFFLRQNQNISLDICYSRPVISFHQEAKSPARDACSLSSDFFLNAASATENLRRILNLDLID